MLPALFMVFDCESVGIHGETFAVGFVVIDVTGLVFASARYACPRNEATGGDEGREWVVAHCPTILADCETPRVVRARFWQDWLTFKQRGAVLVADCAWPVEARFLAACVDDDPETRQWQGPYPVVDVASIRLAAGMDPVADYPRLPDEPHHDPLGDARQSARLLMVALAKLRGESREPAAAG